MALSGLTKVRFHTSFWYFYYWLRADIYTLEFDANRCLQIILDDCFTSNKKRVVKLDEQPEYDQ